MPFVTEHEVEARFDYLERFLRLARRGRKPGASGGEKRAAALAQVVFDEVPGLDASAVAGLIEFVRLASSRPTTAGDFLQDQQFATMTAFAGD